MALLIEGGMNESDERNEISPGSLTRLKSLEQENPTQLIRLVRDAWPHINAALQRGHTLRTIHARLVEDGVNISYGLLALYVKRLQEEAPTTDVIGLANDEAAR